MPAYARPAPGEYDPYYQPYLDLVPARVTDVLSHLKRQGVATMNLMKGLDDERAEYRYAPGKWSVKEILGHLIDTERVFAFRALWIARGEPAAQPGMDQDRWAATADAHRRSLVELWREQHVCRTDHVYLFRSLAPADVGRTGIANGAPVSVRALPWIIAGHEKHHLNVLKERYGIG